MKTNADPIISPEVDAKMDGYLALWHLTYKDKPLSSGYATASPMFRDVKSAWSPYDRDNGVTEAELDRKQVEGINNALLRVENHPRMLRTLLMFEAQNMAVGAAVWRSNRLPRGEEYDVLRLEARIEFWTELQREGCLGG